MGVRDTVYILKSYIHLMTMKEVTVNNIVQNWKWMLLCTNTPMWFIFDSEVHLVANHTFRTEASVLQRNLQKTIVKKLGEHAARFHDAKLSLSCRSIT